MNTTGRIPTGNARLDCASGAIKAIGALSLAVCTATCALAEGWTSKTISINFSGSRDTPNAPTDADFSGVSGAGLYGALPVAGDNWNNFQTHWSGHGSSVSRSQSIKLGDGMIASGVSAEWNASCNYSVTGTATPNNIFHSFLDGSDQQFVTISGLTAANGFPSTCTVYIYCSSDRNNAVFGPKSVNGVTYTYAGGVVKEGSTSWGSRTYAQNNKLVLGGDYLKITNVQVSAEGTVSIAYANCSDGSGITYHGTLSAVQLDFSERSEYALSVNFSGGQIVNDKDYGPISGTDEYGAVPVAGDYWYNGYAKDLSNQTGLLWNDGAAHPADVTLSYTCDHTWANGKGVASGNLFYSYLDDSAHSVTIKGLSSANGFPGYCWVYVYLSTDNGKRAFEPVTVNDVTYTYAANVVCEGGTAWGSSAYAVGNTLVHGGDYLKIGPVFLSDVGDDAGTVNVTVANLGNKNRYRGAIAAVQLAVPVPTTFTLSAVCEGEGTVAIGQRTPAAAVSVDGTFGTHVTETLTATAAAGYIFDHWEGPLGLLTSGTATDAVISVHTSMPVEFKAVFLRDDVVATATWTGGGTAGDLSDPGNWLCANRAGITIEDALPGADSTIVIAGATSFACPENATLSYGAVRFDNVRISTDLDWNGIDLAKVVAGSSIDLCGNDLEVTGTSETVAANWSITDSSTQGEGGELLLTVANGDAFFNYGIDLSGSLRLVKNGLGSYHAGKSGQSYTGGTHMKKGSVVLQTSLQPLGPCDKTQTVRVEKDAALDINSCHNGCFYNYELGGTIMHSGKAESDSWNLSYLWTSRIDLIDDAHIVGGFFYFGSGDEDSRSTLNLNGHTLYMDLTSGAIYVKGLNVDNTGGKIVFTAGSGAISSGLDLAGAGLHFQNASFVFFDVGGFYSVKDFSYSRNYWRCHKTAAQLLVSGTYTAGTYRPPLTLANGATLDLSSQAGAWSAAGQLAYKGKNNSTYSEVGLVSFADEATITVNLAGRADLKAIAEDDSPYIVTWSTPPADSVKFKLDAETRQRGYSVKVRSNGLALLPPRGFMLLVR